MKKTMEIAGRQLAYLDEGQGPALLLGHGYLGESAQWASQVAALKGQYRCIVPELWGHGDSGVMPAGPCTPATLARDHLALLDGLGIDEFVLVGQGLGGIWGVELARLAPTRLKGLVLMGSFVGWEPQLSAERYHGLLDRVEQAGAIPADLAAQLTALFFARQADGELLTRFEARLAHWPAARLATLVAIGRAALRREDRIEWLEELRVPALVLTGCEERIHPVLEGYLMAEVLGCPFKEIPAAGHMAPLENPAFVNQALSEFLAGIG